MTAVNWTITILVTSLSLLAAVHALLNKRDPRAAFGWIAVTLTFPLAGPLLYFLFGINRVNTRARKLRDAWPTFLPFPHHPWVTPDPMEHVEVGREFSELVRISDAVAGRPLVAGNRIDTLRNGEEAFPAMLDAIRSARDRVRLATYIFETNPAGLEFVEALAAASTRGVDVRVLIDGVGEIYSRPHASRLLRRRGVPTARFLPPRLLPPAVHVNLRNHRKLLIVDGETGFTGGMNVGGRHMVLDPANRNPVADLHFRLRGPIVRQLEQVFVHDWTFATDEDLDVPAHEPATAGDAMCRAVVDGPDDDLDRLTTILAGAVSAARRSVRVLSPYFLPPRELIASLQAAALRGVEVEVVIPERSNLPYVDWATTNMLWELLQRGVRVYRRPRPFSHAKLVLVDDHYAQIGSANLDPRSLRLNFEIMVEIYERRFAERLAALVSDVVRGSRAVSMREVDSRPFPIRLRDSLAWVFTPYL